MAARVSLLCCSLFFASLVNAQVAVDVSAGGVRVQTGKSSVSTASNSAGSIDADVEMEGVAVINGTVYIDGERIPKGKRSHTARKSGKTYLIEWGRDGNVSVREK